MNPLSKLFSREAFTSIGLMVLILLVAVQFLRPELKERPVTRDIILPADVKAIFKKSCYDCHSNETQLGWGDQIVPAYWLVARHIRQGRAHLNFSEWDKLTPAERKQKLWEAVNHTALGAMPRADYVFMHPAAKVSDKELTILKNYLASLVVHEPPDTSKINAEAIQYQQWLHTKAQSNLPVSPNRITYDPNYKNWQVLSTSNRFESGTMRVIFGNEIAIQAVSLHKTRPWPDGTRLAKALWTQVTDSAGNARTGAFVQLDFMIKNSQKYASTGGWGFARFKTLKMVPYGKTALFASECINCHRPMKNQDYVFTIPVKTERRESR